LQRYLLTFDTTSLLHIMVQFAEAKVAALTLAAATLSLICCSAVALSIRFDPRGKKSYHLILVQSLLRSDIGLALSIVVYFSVQYHVSGNDLERFCQAFLPCLVYFFLVSSAWTVMLAFRFRSSQNVAAQFNKPPVPMWAVWVLPIIPSIVMLIMSLSLHEVTDARTNSSDTNQSCQFNHSSLGGITTDLICFQAPLIAIMLVNIYTYANGLLALKNAPHSVIARQMKRAGGYLGVLLIVWVPNIAYNLLVICDDTNEPYDNFLVLTVMLSASQVRRIPHTPPTILCCSVLTKLLSVSYQCAQGFLNTCVYVYGNRTMMKWLETNLLCLRLTGRSRSRLSSNHRASVEAQLESGQGGKDAPEPRPNEDSTTETEDDLDDDSEWLQGSHSMSAPKGVRAKAFADNLSDITEDTANTQVINVLVQTTRSSTGTAGTNGTTSGASGGSDLGSRKSLGSLHSVKSILIGEKNSKNITKKNSGYYPDMDSEKFVRFGT
jgi:hypothetical protein